MNAKIERVCKDIQKTKEKINEFQTKLRELEKQKTELENLEIVDAVRGMDISLTDLADLLKVAKADGATSGQLGPKPAVPAQLKRRKSKNEDETERAYINPACRRYALHSGFSFNCLRQRR